MTGRLPTPAELLRARPPGPAGVDADANGVVHRWMDLADRGNYLDAAERAAELLRAGAGDIRIIAIYLVGWFVERGAPVLPELLACVDGLLGDGPASPASARTIDSTVEWLFRTVGDRVAFHAARRDEVWDAWLQEVTPAHIDAIAARSDAIIRKRPADSSEALHKLVRWARNKLAPAAERAKKTVTLDATPEPEPPPPPPPPPPRGWDEPDDDEDAAPAAVEHDEHDGHGSSYPPPARRVRSEPAPGETGATVTLHSPALAALRDKLRAFEVLLARGKLDRAAVVARDIQDALERFDPLVYLPSLLARYTRLLAACLPELESHWDEADSARWRVLVQFYRTDLAGFVDE
jgi:hypothetical protein